MKTSISLALCTLAFSLSFNQARAEQFNQKEIQEMVVVGSRLPTQDYKVGRSITVLDQAQIEDMGYNSGADLFRFVPGVAVSRTGGFGGATQLRLRGAEANHVVVLVDGIDVTAAGSGEFDFSSLLAGDIERIEVLRGPQSGLYGSNALAGVISIHTKTPDSGFGTDINLEAGSHDTRLGSVSLSGGNPVAQGRLTYTQRRSEFDLSEDDSVIGSEDDKDDNQTLSGQLRVALSDDFNVNFFGRRTDKETEMDGFGPIDDNSFSDTEDQTLGLTANFNLADGRSINRLAIEQSDNELDAGTFGSESERRQYRFDSTWQWTEGSDTAHRTTLFLQREEEEFQTSGGPRLDRDLTGYGIEHRIELNDQIFINGTVRRDNNDEFEDETTYSIDTALLLNDGATRLHASYGRGVTNPTFFEQFGFIPGIFVGNPDLVPEESVGWDFGVEQQFLDGALVVDLTYFDADLEDEIQGLFLTVNNLNGQSERSGVELSSTYQPDVDTYLTFSYTYTDADEPAGEEVRRAEHMASLSAARQLMDNKLRLSAGVVYNGEQLDTVFDQFFNPIRTKVDSYVLFNVGANYALNENVDVYLRVENALDEDYEEVIGYATPGSSVYGGVRVRLGN